MKRLAAFTTALLCSSVLPTWAQDMAAGAAGATQAEHAEAPSAGLPQFNPHWWPGQIAWLLVIFVVLYTFFAKKTLPEIGGVLEKRRGLVQSDLAQAESLRQQAATAQEQYETLMHKTRVESTHLMHDAIVHAKKDTEQKLRALQDRGAEQIAALEKNLQNVSTKAKQDMQGQIAEIASIAAQKIVGITPDLGRANILVQSLKGTEAA